MISGEDSDTSDEEYIPGSKPEEVVSEVESDGDPEDDLSDTEEKNSGKRSKNNRKSRKKPFLNSSNESTKKGESEELNEEDKKKIADDVWADFMKDTGFQYKKSITEHPIVNKANITCKKPDEARNVKLVAKPSASVKITQTFQFAGEEVTVEREVPRESADARLLNTTSSGSATNFTTSKKGGLSGIGNVLSQLGKKPKISTLEKSKLDWDKFKKEENLEEELKTHNKGKDGYLERQDFLQRADLRRFEIEKEIRTIERTKRMNNL